MGARLEDTNTRESPISLVVLKLEHFSELPRASHSVSLGSGPRSAFLTHFQTVMLGLEPDVEDHLSVPSLLPDSCSSGGETVPLDTALSSRGPLYGLHSDES